MEQQLISFTLPIPLGVRIATQADEQRLYNFLQELYRDNFIGFSMSPVKVWETIKHCTRAGGGVAAIIESPEGEIVASTGIVFSSMWFSDDPYLSELWLFVHPHHRKHGYADLLADFCHQYRNAIRDDQGNAMPLITSVTSEKRLAAKMQWWNRWATLCGAIYKIDGS